MNSDTQRAVNTILKEGYYLPYQGLGEGGWPFLYKQGIREWKQYILYLPDDFMEEITAKNEQSAIAAFHSRYHLEEVEYEIVEKTVTYRTIE